MENVVIISGISKGLGFNIAKSLLSSGWRVSGFSRKKSDGIKDLEKKYKNKILFYPLDIKDHKKIDRFLLKTKRLGKIYGLINNAGSVNENLLARQSEKDINNLIKIGRIINITSIVAKSGYKGTVAYSAAKSGLEGVTKSLARELGKRNITVNSVAPGYMKTDLTKKMDPKKLNQIIRRTPLGRPGDVKDVIGIVNFCR